MSFSYFKKDQKTRPCSTPLLNSIFPHPLELSAGPFGDYVRRLGRWRFTSQIRSHGLLVITNSYRIDLHRIKVIPSFAFVGSEFVTLLGTICKSWRVGSRWLGLLWTNKALWKIQCKDGYLECSRMSHHTSETICSGCHHRRLRGVLTKKILKDFQTVKPLVGKSKKASILDLKLSEVRQVTYHFPPFFTSSKMEKK